MIFGALLLLACYRTAPVAGLPSEMAGKVVETGFQFDHAPKRLIYFKDSEVRRNGSVQWHSTILFRFCSPSRSLSSGLDDAFIHRLSKRALE